jgi:uncharacterized protein (DUF1697 family)
VTRQVGLLRGINVGGRNRVAMAQLRELMEALGYTGVETLLQSGNVVFGSKQPAATSERRIAKRLHAETGLDIKVLVRTRAELAAVVKRNPLGEHADNPKHHHVVFLSARPQAGGGRRPGRLRAGDVRAARARAVHVVAGRGTQRPSHALLLGA